MPTLPHLISYVKTHGVRNRPLYALSFMAFFWTIFDGIMSYITPLLITQNGFSNAMMGVIIGSSSVIGCLFDFIVCKVFKSTHVRRVFLFMFIVCSFYPLILWQSKGIWMFLLAMAVWGIYYDLYGFGAFDFIGRYVKKEDHTSSFGVIQVFRNLGSILAPLIVGLVVAELVGWEAFALGWVFLGISFLFFLVLAWLIKKHSPVIGEEIRKRRSLLVEWHLWKKLGKTILPLLAITFFLFMVEAFFWTLAPLYAETIHFGEFGGLFLAADTLPALIIGWFVGRITKKIEKKEVAIWGVLIGSLILSSFFLISSPIVIILIVFLSSCFMSIAIPTINGIYADYISETPLVESEIEALEDFSFNLGYIFGPVFAGILSQFFSITISFTLLGMTGAILALTLFLTTPGRITVRVSPAEIQ